MRSFVMPYILFFCSDLFIVDILRELQFILARDKLFTTLYIINKIIKIGKRDLEK